jgi:endonuclease/exonuclease/phosphatase family metal-dependent hydrolase
VRVEIRAVTFNVLYRGDARARLRALGEVLREASHDVVCLQEVFSPLNLALLRKVTKGSHPHVAHGGVFPAVAGGVVTVSRWPITARRYLSYPLTRPVRRGWLLRKGVLVTQHQIRDQRLTVMNTHLTANMDTDWSSAANSYVRAEQAELRHLAGVVRRATSAVPLMVVGDFNVPRNSSYFQDFAQAAGLRDVLAGDTEPTYRPIPDWPRPPAIDQVLVRPSESYEISAEARLCFQDQVTLPGGRSAYLSDHFGIEADLQLVRR